MSDSVQPGTEIDADVWREFREEVERRRGGIRGHLRTELENALRAYTEGGEATPADVDRRLARIEAAVGVEATDGGTDTSEPSSYTHTPEQAPDEKPHQQSPTEEKVRWLAHRVSEEEADGDRPEAVPKVRIREVVKDEYAFRADTAKRYVEEVISHFDLVEHPFNDAVYVTPGRRDELVEKRREQERDEAQERTEDL